MTEWNIQSRGHACGACGKTFADKETYHTLLFDEKADSLLHKLIGLNAPRYVRPAYIPAVMLERKRLLKIKEQLQRDGHRVFIYEQPATGDVFTIVDPNLHLNQLEQVQHDVAALLEHGLNPPIAVPGAEAASQ